MKKSLFTAALGVIMLMTGCAQKMPEYYSEIKQAKENYEKLSSAHILMTDLKTGEDIMEFSFFLNGNDEMVFSYRGVTDGEEEQAYSDGAQFFYQSAGEEGWRIITSDDESYLYNLYNKTYRYPYARGSIFFLDGTSVESVSAEGGEGAPLFVTYVYDPEGLNSYAAKQLENVSAFSSLTAVYELDSEGYITSFTETGIVTDSEGVESEVNMRITVDKMNEVYEIPYPVGELILE